MEDAAALEAATEEKKSHADVRGADVLVRRRSLLTVGRATCFLCVRRKEISLQPL